MKYLIQEKETKGEINESFAGFSAPLGKDKGEQVREIIK